MIKRWLAALMEEDKIVYELIEVTYKNKVILTQYYPDTKCYKSADTSDWYFYDYGAFKK